MLMKFCELLIHIQISIVAILNYGMHYSELTNSLSSELS
jgi:hypothetical protein